MNKNHQTIPLTLACCITGAVFLGTGSALDAAEPPYEPT